MLDRIVALGRPSARSRVVLVVALTLVLGLLVYYSFLGVRYWLAESHVRTLSDQIVELEAELNSKPTGIETASPELELKANNLDELEKVYVQMGPDQHVEILSASALQAQVEMVSVTSHPLQLEVEAGVEYSKQDMSISLHGDRTDIYSYLALLQEQNPTLSVSGLRMTGLEGVSTAHIELTFYGWTSVVTEG